MDATPRHRARVFNETNGGIGGLVRVLLFSPGMNGEWETP